MCEDHYRQLTLKIAASDEQAFDDLFRSLYARLVRFSCNYTMDNEPAADIVQQAFIKLWQKRKQLNPEQSVKSYMYRIVRNLSLNYIRDNAMIVHTIDFEDVYSDGQENSFSQQNETLEDKSSQMLLLEEWIISLPERQKDALTLSKFEGLNHEEIADIMQVSKNTVNNHIVSAMKNIKKLHDKYLQKAKAGYA